jgi:hypothetical protein
MGDDLVEVSANLPAHRPLRHSVLRHVRLHGVRDHGIVGERAPREARLLLLIAA